ncbi:aminotransferase class I/II-fold pyridoxal phosphate-dependent enzyme [[Mycobacterium] nativiensis]|uniref:Aminotransferase class I/II-fold pyridoxal phosphate-dependent enzyme n=1 Tax=[Mycobacterium] nativiensis TaxID=2855503 RepID=A0ABU5Y111_9MYCO|nr:aminotransferase class I/II-fold pyridoxal phosphate-dependent enzyme [Mycolicibacter sp. MYC340]MEB3032585.1 aminotransferase class I/II-fold pyridoxal phosphate-dependent enzyme [Mycolicibacter sp. MYC340]
MTPMSVAGDPFALSLNENPFPPLPAVSAALIQSIGAANRYPDFLPTRLRRLVADHARVPEETVMLGAGASGVTMQILHAMTRPGDRIVLSRPTFDGYPIFARMARLTTVEVPLDRYGHHDLTAMARAAASARVVVLCRPHNPTGTLESATDVERFLTDIPGDTIVLLDEAYREFVAPHQRLDVSELIGRFPNVVVLRTFSKAYGLAALRIGYGLAAPAPAALLWAMQIPFGIPTSCMVAVEASYDAEAQLRQRIEQITAERHHLQARLRSAGVYTTDSQANFVYLPAAGRPWREIFFGTGLQVRHYPDGAVRITIGTRTSTRMVLSAVERALSGPADARHVRTPRATVHTPGSRPVGSTAERWPAPALG